jgi:hypothetical protein
MVRTPMTFDAFCRHMMGQYIIETRMCYTDEEKIIAILAGFEKNPIDLNMYNRWVERS